MKIRRVVGKSMLPGLAPGDILLVSKKYKPTVGDIVVAKVGGREVVKRVVKVSKKKYFLQGDNLAASTDSRTYGEVPASNIVGVAVWALGLSRLKKSSKKSISRKKTLYFSTASLGLLLIIGFAMFQLKHVYSQSSQKNNIATNVPKVQPKYAVNKTQTDVPYCNGQALDIYYPRKAVYETAPVVMYFHGGGWQINNKSSEPGQLAMIDGLRDAGFAIVSIDYRKLPENFFPAPVSDALCSVRYLRATKATTGLDTDKIAIYGFSAGGHLAAMVGALDSKNSFNEGPYKEQSSRVQAVVTLASVFSFESALRSANELKINYFLNGKDRLTAQPISYITKDDPAFLMVHGLQDQYVDPAQDTLFSEKLTAAGVNNRIVQVQNAEHGLGSINGQAQPSKDEIKKIMHDFIKQQLL
jgi:acetyl esterase/lipase